MNQIDSFDEIAKELEVIFKVIKKLESIGKAIDPMIHQSAKELYLLIEMHDSLSRVEVEYRDKLSLVGRQFVVADILNGIRREDED